MFRAFFALDPNTRVLFVDDGSRDKTLSVLESVCRGHEHRASILRCSRNRGKAEAVRCGVLHSLERHSDPIIGFWDADLATPLESACRLRCVFEECPGVEMVFGARVKLLGRQVERRPARHYLGRVFATVVSEMLDLPIYDTQCGAKLFRVTSKLKEVFSEPFLSRWVFDVEILSRYLRLYNGDSKRLAQAIYEYPLEMWVDVRGSKVRAIDFATALVDLLRIRKRYLSSYANRASRKAASS